MFEKLADIFEKTNDIKRSAYVWNAINAMLSALQCPLILMVLPRTTGMEDAGIYSLAFAVANLMLYIGLYGLRRFQASDINEEYSFGDYNGMRIITCLIMSLACLAFAGYGLIFRSYSTNKALIILCVSVLKLVQAYTDVIHGNMQQKGRLDVATKCSALRYVLEVGTIIVVVLITRDLLTAALSGAIVSVLVAAMTSGVSGKRYIDSYKPSFNMEKVRSLAVNGFPLFVGLFLNMYISNAPKYAIDRYLDEETQAVYNLIFMPAFMVMLLSNFIFNPIIKSYAELWLSGTKEKLHELKASIMKQNILILGLTALGLLVAATIGIPVLGAIFGVDLSEYKKELCVVMIGGGALGFATFYSTVLTIIREQKPLMICYIVASLAAFFSSSFFVVKYGIMGAAMMYAVIMCILAVLLGLLLFGKLFGISSK